MYITFSSTTKNERVNGKIHKYYIECKTMKRAVDTFFKAKFNGTTHYVSMRYSKPKYAIETHTIIDNYKSATEFKKKYKGK